jgi:hypothetical protein
MKLRRRSFRTAAGWSFARAHAPRLASFGQNARWVRFAKMRRPSPSSFETRVRRARIRGISSACALLRMRTTEVAARRRTVFGNSRLTMSNSHSRSRGAFGRPGFCNFASLTPNRGVGGAPRNVRVQRHPLGLHMTRQARRLRGALRPIARQDARERAYDAGRSPLGAPPWRFWAPGAALPSPWAPAVLQRRAVALRIRRASSSHPGRSAWRAGSRASRGERLRAAAAGRHSPLRLQDRLRRRPSMSEDANPVA